MFSAGEKIGFVLSVVVVAIMGFLVAHGHFNIANKKATGPVQSAAVIQGKADFTSLSCGGCHTLKSVGSSGTVGPDLDGIGTQRSTAWLIVQLTKPCSKGHIIAGYPAADCHTMEGVANGLNDTERKDLAAFLSSQK